MYVYLIETKAVHSSAFPALFYLPLVLSAILIRSTTWINGGDRVYADSKHVFGCTSLQLRKAGWGPGNKATHSSGRTGESCSLASQPSWLARLVSSVIKTRMFLRGLDEVCQLHASWGWSVTL